MARQIWSKLRCLKTRNSKDVLSHQTSSPLHRKITPKPHFEGPFNAKPIIEIAICKSHVNGATKVKRYSYRYRQVLGVCKNVSARGRLGGLGPLNVNLGPLLPRKLLELARKLKLKTQ